MAIAVFRGIRKSNNIRHRLIQHAESSPPRRPSDDFHDNTWLPLCTGIATPPRRTHRTPLTEDENRILWKARSPLVLGEVPYKNPHRLPRRSPRPPPHLPPASTAPTLTPARCERAIKLPETLRCVPWFWP